MQQVEVGCVQARSRGFGWFRCECRWRSEQEGTAFPAVWRRASCRRRGVWQLDAVDVGFRWTAPQPLRLLPLAVWYLVFISIVLVLLDRTSCCEACPPAPTATYCRRLPRAQLPCPPLPVHPHPPSYIDFQHIAFPTRSVQRFPSERL